MAAGCAGSSDASTSMHGQSDSDELLNQETAVVMRRGLLSSVITGR
jgi:hypothetical protein